MPRPRHGLGRAAMPCCPLRTSIRLGLDGGGIPRFEVLPLRTSIHHRNERENGSYIRAATQALGSF